MPAVVLVNCCRCVERDYSRASREGGFGESSGAATRFEDELVVQIGLPSSFLLEPALRGWETGVTVVLRSAVDGPLEPEAVSVVLGGNEAGNEVDDRIFDTRNRLDQPALPNASCNGDVAFEHQRTVGARAHQQRQVLGSHWSPGCEEPHPAPSRHELSALTETVRASFAVVIAFGRGRSILWVPSLDSSVQ